MGSGGVRRGDATTSQTRGVRGGKNGKGHGIGMVCDKEGNRDSNEGNGKEGGGQAMVTRAMAMGKAMTWVMAMAMRLVGNNEGKGKHGKGNGDGNKGEG